MTSSYPPEIETLFKVLSDDLSWLRIRWAAYRELYGKSRERIDLMNEAAPAFFFVVQDALYDDVVLNICRLCDPPQSGQGKGAQPNLTLQRLADVVQGIGHSALHAALIGIIDKLKDAVASMIKYRHKHIAHSDLDISIRKAVLAGPSRQDVETALSLIADVLNAVSKEYRDSTVLYEASVARGGGPDQLLNLVKAGFRYGVLRDAGVIPYTDDPRGKWRET